MPVINSNQGGDGGPFGENPGHTKTHHITCSHCGGHLQVAVALQSKKWSDGSTNPGEEKKLDKLNPPPATA